MAKLVIPKQEARIQQGRLDGHVLARKTHAIGGRAEGVANLQPHVPEGVEHILNDALGMRRSLVGPNEEKVDVARRGENVATISTRCKDGEPLAFCRVAGPVHVYRDIIIQCVQDLVLDGSQKACRVETVRALLQTLLRNHPPPEKRPVEMVQHFLARRSFVAEIVQRRRRQLDPQGAAINDVGNLHVEGQRYI